jgi:hypothetical protein
MKFRSRPMSRDRRTENDREPSPVSSWNSSFALIREQLFSFGFIGGGLAAEAWAAFSPPALR